MKILTAWLRAYLPTLAVSDRQLADDLTLRGIAVEGVHPLGPNSEAPEAGHLFEMDITTNRVDAMNHYGIAREAATIYNLPLKPLESELPAISSTPSSGTTQTPGAPSSVLTETPGAPSSPAEPERVGSPVTGSTGEQDSPTPFPVRIEAPHLCGRFTAQVLRDVNIAPSTGPVKTFFDLLGQKQISNAVDASNFTLLGMGHPTHAFDLDKIHGGIVVRLARKGETLKLLDGTERTLEPDDLVIADETQALSLAGVMGGHSSMITPETKNILVEAAWFDPASIRRSSRRHLLHTDASHRFERGADFNAAPVANRLVSELILQSGGHAEGSLVDIVDPATEGRTAQRPPIALSVKQVQRHLGTTLDDTPQGSALTADLVTQYLTALGCTLTPSGSDTFSVHLPSWRLDLEREIDLIEEVARVYGYNRFANTLPTPLPVLAHPTAASESAIRTRLLALGFSETVSSTFASAPDSHLFAPATEQGSVTHVPMENPLSEEASNLRPSLLPGMLTMLGNNLNRDVLTARLFEQGHIFRATGSGSPTHIDGVDEQPALTIGLTAATPQATALYPASDAPIFELKAAIESLATLFTLPTNALTFTTADTPAWLEPGRSATALLGTQPLAHFGELARSESSRRKLRQPVFLAELDLALLYTLPLRKVTARDLSRFQAVDRDFSFLFPDSVHWHTVASAIHALSLPDLQRLSPVEIFRDPPSSTKPKAVPAGHHSLLLRTVFQSPTRTLTEDELTAASDRIIEALTKLGGVHRDS